MLTAICIGFGLAFLYLVGLVITLALTKVPRDNIRDVLAVRPKKARKVRPIGEVLDLDKIRELEGVQGRIGSGWIL